MMLRIGAAAIALLALVLLGLRVLDQDERIERLGAEIAALRSQYATGNTPAAAPAPPAPTAAAPVAAPAQPAAQPQPAQRVAVSRDEVALIESAVLQLLESDHPELRAKLRAVVQEQQQSLEQAEREERRERWIARNEARLLELGEQTGLSAAQREAVSHILLASRDEMADVRQTAKTPQEITAARDKLRALREQSAEQVRQLLNPAQYDAYQAEFNDDDDDAPQRRRARTQAR